MKNFPATDAMSAACCLRGPLFTASIVFALLMPGMLNPEGLEGQVNAQEGVQEKTQRDFAVLDAVSLSDERVCALMDLALQGIEHEFPNKPSNVMASAEDVLSPKEMHPVFYGCFDWHSSVHGHWLLVRMLKLYPDSSRAKQARELLDRQLTAEKLQLEADYFEAKENKSFERMYGWAWLLRLSAELEGWDDADGQRWSAALRPLELTLVGLAKDYIPKLTFPIRTGQHADTGFALAQLWDYAVVKDDDALQQLIVDYARGKYLADTNYPARYEPSGHDFFSSCLNEADLMRRVLNGDEFRTWLTRFLPELSDPNGSAKSLLTPAEVSDVTDGKLVHLAGLNFNRAWTQLGVLSALSPDDPRAKILQQSIEDHTATGLNYVFSGHYEGEHWLATFAVYTLTRSGI
ncbi:MAG: DUF2891 domain-containing protein [Pirellulaceae bacterium]